MLPAATTSIQQENLQVIRMQEQQRVEHDVEKVLPILHGIVSTLNHHESRLQPSKNLYEFRDVTQVLSHLLDTKLLSASIATAKEPEETRGRQKARNDMVNGEGNTKRRSSPRALSLERRQKRHKSFGTL